MTIHSIDHHHSSDAMNRDEALDTNKSFIVQAPAGSGKTELLIQRYLVLLDKINSPDEILAITFTKKAANEMKERVLKALNDAKNNLPTHTPHEIKTRDLANRALLKSNLLDWKILDNPNQLRIQTIDSLNAYLTAQLPYLSSLGSNPTVCINPEELYQEAIVSTLNLIELETPWSQDIISLLTHFDNNKDFLAGLLLDMLKSRDQWMPHLFDSNTHDQNARLHLESNLKTYITHELAHLENAIPSDLADRITDMLYYSAQNLNDALLITLCEQVKSLAYPEANDHLLYYYKKMASFFLTNEETFRKQLDTRIGFPPKSQFKNPDERKIHESYKQNALQLIHYVSENIPHFQSALIEILNLPHSAFEDKDWNLLSALINTLKILCAQLRITFQKMGQIDFIENALSANEALGGLERPSDLAIALDCQIKHILIDEFQDTSYTQFQLIKQLTGHWTPDDGHTLFIVGDPMQSIYRFRQAEVGIFLDLFSHGLSNINLMPLVLDMNFRSHSSIIQWNNSQFSNIFPDKNNKKFGAVTYTPSRPKKISPDDSRDFPVDIAALPTSHRQGDYIAHKIKELQSRYSLSQIAILVRSRKHLNDIIPLLKKNHLPINAIDINPLAESQTIHDLVSLTAALLNPTDRISYLSLLRSPLCGLRLNDLMIIANQPELSILESINLESVKSQLSEDGLHRINRILPPLLHCLSNRFRYPLVEWVKSVWLSLGGPACIHYPHEKEDIESFFGLLKEIDSTHINIDRNFLITQINQLYSKNQEPNSLNVMTIHASKGLEFPIVIIPHLEKSSRADNKSILNWIELPLHQESLLLLAPLNQSSHNLNSIYSTIRRLHEIKSENELSRLLYVAMTRAKEKLILTYAVDLEQEKVSAPPNSFLSAYWDSFENHLNQHLTEGMKYQSYSNLNTFPDSNTTITDHSLKRLASDWTNPITTSNNLIMDTSDTTSDMFLYHTDEAILQGLIFHAIIQSISDHSIEWWQSLTDSEKMKLIINQSKKLNCPISLMQHTSNSVNDMLIKMINDPRGMWILSNKNQSHAEYALQYRKNNHVKTAILDYIFVDENNVYWIIDYKTSRPTNEAIETFLMREKKIYFQKMNEYYSILRNITDQTIKLGLYFPAIPAWIEWDPSEIEVI